MIARRDHHPLQTPAAVAESHHRAAPRRRRRARRPAAVTLGALVVVVGALAGCGQGSSAATPGSSTTSSAQTSSAVQAQASGMSCPVVISKFGVDRADLVGMTLTAAKAQEKAAGRTIRVVGQDGVCNDITDDFNQYRVDVLVVDGEIVWAYTG